MSYPCSLLRVNNIICLLKRSRFWKQLGIEKVLKKLTSVFGKRKKENQPNIIWEVYSHTTTINVLPELVKQSSFKTWTLQ